ncbi:Uma2 family endonuclease [Sphingomonas sp. SUN039]|uniref:Uma2 family endonuclease n=1 Tax=Sphingomonas sp. SUN039 TaxID=2937787 RepID=UPI002164369C|nr:Uma2 family endonuclease [Sphingomonas sp. SUN039]UVO53319.1 Uma2 family endonuclease [Sphingomonas sp. SUN039]
MNAVTPFPSPKKIGLRAIDYLMLSDAGAFDGYGRTELIEGEVWTLSPAHSWHARTVSDFNFELGLALRKVKSSLRVFSGGSVSLTDDSVPEPDISVCEDNDEGVLPLAKLKLAIEISDSTAATDLGVKLRLYAGAGVPEYWVVERDARVIHQMWAPSDGVYAERRAVAFGERVTAATLADVSIETSEL